MLSEPNKGDNSLRVYLEPIFNGSLLGTIIYPEDDLYGYATEHYNVGLRQSFPGAVVFCRTEDDVVACVKASCKWNFEVHIRCGRHDYGGFSSGSGLIIDISRMKKCKVDTNTKIATLGSGFNLGEIYPYLAQYNLTVNGGTCPGVGLAGLILGGGAGPFERMHGMFCDMMVSARIVLADGSVITADKNNNNDLFWALRGGGAGTFGVVTEFEIQCFDIPNNGIDYHISWKNWGDSTDVIMAYQDVLTKLKIDNIWLRLFMMSLPGGNASLSLTVHYLGDINTMKQIIQPILNSGNVDWGSENYTQYYDSHTYIDHIASWGNCGQHNMANCNDMVTFVPVPGDQSLIVSNSFGIPTTIQIRASNGKWISARPDGKLRADADTPSVWETFTIRALPDPWNVKEIQLQAYNGKWVSAENGGGSGITYDKDTPSGWETFKVDFPWHSYNIQLQSMNGQWFTLYGDEVRATSNSPVPFYLNHDPPDYNKRHFNNAMGNRFKSLFGGVNPENGRTPQVMDRKGIQFLVDMIPTYPGPAYGGMALIDSTGGKQGRFTDSAYAHREVLWITQLMANYSIHDLGKKREVIEWMRKLHDGLAVYAQKTGDNVPLAYRNYADLDIKFSSLAYYEKNVDGLISVKNKYDPNNVFTYSQAFKSSNSGTTSNPSNKITCYSVYGR